MAIKGSYTDQQKKRRPTPTPVPAGFNFPLPAGNSGIVTTTDSTQTALLSIPVVLNKTILIEAIIIARRTGGTSGSEGDSAGYVLNGCYKDVNGTVSEVGETSVFSAEDQAQWTATMDISGTNVLLLVTGASGNTVNWSITYKVHVNNNG